MTQRRTQKTLDGANGWTRQRVIILAARLILGGVFVFASIDKILHPAAFAEAVYNYQILPDSLINLTAIILPWMELVLGSLLIIGIWMPGTVLVSNLLLLSQFPDVEADKTGKRKTTPITAGFKKAATVYAVTTIIMYLWIIGAVIARVMPVFTLLALLTLPFAIKAIRAAFKPEDMNKLVPGMANNVMVVLITQLLMGVGYILSRVFLV